MTEAIPDTTTAAEAIVAMLAARGVDYFFGNAGTDFPPIIEAFAKFAAQGRPAPVPVTAPHENTAMGMAHGYYLATGRPQAVMVHTIVGTANAVMGVMNASRQNVPVLVMAGRTPITEQGQQGSRNRVIHWAQEAYDQAGALREFVKWDYELRNGEQVEAVIDRALRIAMSEPRGPVYLSLPREVLAGPSGAFSIGPARAPTGGGRPAADDLEQAADILAAAKAPLIIISGSGRFQNSVAPLADLAQDYAIPVVANSPRHMCLPTNHPMHLGFEPGSHVVAADAIVVLECDVPWIPSIEGPSPEAKVIHIGVDPAYAGYPIHSFPADIAMSADPSAAIRDLAAALGERLASKTNEIEERRTRIGQARKDMLGRRQKALELAATARPIDRAWVTHCIDRVKDSDTIVVNESPLAHEHLTFDQPGQFFSAASVGGLGWGLGAALGIKLGAPERLVIAGVGDGAYIFGNPTSVHMVGRALDLPTLTVICNNRMWGAVSRSTKSMYADGFAAKSNQPPLTHLEPAPDYELIVQASGGYGERVDEPDALIPALERAVAVVKDERRQAVLNVITAGI